MKMKLLTTKKISQTNLKVKKRIRSKLTIFSQISVNESYYKYDKSYKNAGCHA